MSFELNSNNEYWIISYYFKNPDLWADTEKELFCIPTSVNICEALERMYTDGIKVYNVDTLYNYLHEAKIEIERDALQDIYDSYHDYHNIEEAFSLLKKDKIRQIVNDGLLADLFDNVHTGLKTEEDVDNIQNTLSTIQDKISFIKKREEILLNSETLVDNHKARMEERKKTGKKTTGDSALDRILVNPFAPGEQTTIFGQKSSGKSTFAQNIASSLNMRRVPVLFVNLEMGQEAYMDKAICMRTGYPLDVVMYTQEEAELKKIYATVDSMKRFNLFHMIDNPVISINDLDRYVQEKQRILDQEYIVTFVDLSTMLQDFSNAKNTREMDRAVNRLNELAKKTHTHIVNIVQENENRFRGNKVHRVKSLKYFKPKITDIKDAASIAERSRVVMYVWNEYLMRQSFFPDEEDDDADDNVDDTRNFLEVKVVKQNMGAPGGYAKYLYQAECFRLTPYQETKGENDA